MDYWSDCPATALAAAGIVGQWEHDPQTQTGKLDRAGAKYRFDDESLAGVTLPQSKILAGVHPDDQEMMFERSTEAFARGGPFMIEHRLILPHLGLRIVEVRGFIGLNEHDNVIARGVLIDITPINPSATDGAHRLPNLPRLPYASFFDPLAEAAAHGIEVREALGQSGHGALRLAADLLLFEINTALAERLTRSDKPVPGLSDPSR